MALEKTFRAVPTFRRQSHANIAAETVVLHKTGRDGPKSVKTVSIQTSSPLFRFPG